MMSESRTCSWTASVAAESAEHTILRERGEEGREGGRKGRERERERERGGGGGGGRKRGREGEGELTEADN